MSFTNDLDLELQASGANDWDTALNANFALLEKGFTFRVIAGTQVNTNTAIYITNSGYAVPYDPRSMGLGPPPAVSRLAVASGASGLFTHMGTVRSMASASLVAGAPVFASPNPASLGMLVSSYAGYSFPIGTALSANAIVVQPQRIFPELITLVESGVAYVNAASYFNFSVPIGHRGIITKLEVGANSLSDYAFKVQLWSGSARASSEAVYETLTRSWAVSSRDVASSSYKDAAGFPFKNTDTASWALLFGRITVQSGHGATSGSFSVSVEMERLR